VELSALSMESGPYHAVRIGGSKTRVSSEMRETQLLILPRFQPVVTGYPSNDETISQLDVKSQPGREVTENQSGKLLQLRFVKLN
jgi:hypothetical protein